jgi:MFS transporter, YNFM family, putative membrane transport protein
VSHIPGSAASHNTSEQSSRLWALVTLFFAPAFIFANMYTTQAILPVLSQDFAISAPTAGLTVSVLVLTVAFGSLFYGPLSDRIGRKPVMVGVSFLVIIPTLLCGLAPNFATLVAFRTLQGLLMPGLTGVAISYVNEEFAGKGRGLAMGIYVSGLTLGGLFARGGSAVLTSLYNWRIAMLAFALPTLVALPFPSTARSCVKRCMIWGFTCVIVAWWEHSSSAFRAFLPLSASSPISPTILPGPFFACLR